MKNLYLVFLLFLFPILGFAQNSPFDTLTDEEVDYEFFGKTKFELKLTSNRSLVNDGYSVRGNNLTIGLKFLRRYKAGMLIFFTRPIRVNVSNREPVVAYDLDFDGFGVYGEYVFFDNYRYEVTTPISFVRTRVYASALDVNGRRVPELDTASSYFSLLSLGGSGTYHLNYWFGFGASFGYRFSFSSDPVNRDILSSFYYSFGVKFQIGRLYKAMFHRDHVLKMKSLYFRGRNEAKYRQYKDKYHVVFDRKYRRKSRKSRN